ncbi:PQQ-binding-like beta-propeller repeat protein [candidate division WOR-3 bacterium]|nr:PQQ-binding-like beta-propeller repeat protein [candidate division WOR-3 bacterium]
MISIFCVILLIPTYLNGVGIEKIEQDGRCKTITHLIPVQSSRENMIEVKRQVFSSENRREILWQYADPVAIAKNVSITPDSKYIWVFQELNNERLQLFDISISIPQWGFSLDHFDDPYGGIDTWSEGSDTLFAASLYDGIIDTLYMFGPGSNIPIWKKGFVSGMWRRELSFSGDGSRLILAGYRSGPPEEDIIYSFNAASGESLWTYAIPESGAVYSVDASNDGNIIFAVTRYNTYVFENGSLRWSSSNPYEACCGAMSADGKILCRGDYYGHLYTYSWNGSTYLQKWSYYIPPTAGYYNWVGSVDVSDDGKTIVIGSLETISTGDAGRVAMFDSSSGTPLWEYTDCGDYVPSVAITPDGEVAVAGSWGDIPNLCDDILVFERDSGNPIFSHSSPGSIFSVDVSNNGEYAVAGAKAVHATQPGNGGYVYAIETGYTGLQENQNIPKELVFVVYPNPFIDKTDFRFQFADDRLQKKSFSLKIYDISGRLIKQISLPAAYSLLPTVISWNGTDDSGRKVPPGVYFIRLMRGDFHKTEKAILLR